MRKISADYIFPVSSAPIKNGIVVVGDDGQVLDVFHPGSGAPVSEVEQLEGIICPGFINAHCHLELSHLAGKLEKQKGLDEFIKEIEAIRKSTGEEIQSAIIKAEEEMIVNGIVAAGDISNTDYTFLQKSKGRLNYHTFIEVLGFHPDRAEKAFSEGLKLYGQINHPGSIVPHAPYSASEKLLKKINDFAYEHNSILTIHNQESEEEDKLFKNKEGKILKRLEHFGIETSSWKHTGFSSLQSTLVHLPKCNKIQLVHNTYTSKEDIAWAQDYSKLLWWCFCPNANLYIENSLPAFQQFIDANAKITIGTDSMASNWSLSILEELKTIARYAPQISLQQLLTWATKNGAEFLGFNNLGTIEKGKNPGLNLVKNIDKDTLQLTKASSVISLL